MTKDLQDLNKVEQFSIDAGISADELVRKMGKSGVMGAGRISTATDIITTMFKDKDCTVFLGAAGALVPGGMRNILIDVLNTGKIKVFVTTGAMLTHDLVEALGYHHYKGSARVDDAELQKKGIDRMFDSFMPNNVYEGMEDFFTKHFDEIFKEKMSIKQFIHQLGSMVPKDKPSILRSCFEKNIDIYCPAISDSGIGLMIWGHLAKNKKVDVQVFDDLKDILNTAWDAKKSGFIYLGGGVPKNFIQQAMQFSKGAAYGVQVTMDRPEPGGSSGAELREGISWGKLNEKANFTDVICDVTIALPLIWSAVKTRMK
ncbi:MAG: deoxyhypusine synthase family protein [Nanoarchaeota archaeon]|nr:deoxyhypusine synthase family protein [Nanoarchaeota archaeon]MBU1320855.1 deoxyhypusine synthase family protein [Nanoarchaeota archaeon]MBU1597921.1 deoxyhypusine synthase family protein [Nanoarchaeota archaeon]MBU2441343.1 deoxyhypusine synthase family protein [Nanoarchaeota archaeon]